MINLQRTKNAFAPSAAEIDHPDSSFSLGLSCLPLVAGSPPSAADLPADWQDLREEEGLQACRRAGHGSHHWGDHCAVVERYLPVDLQSRMQVPGVAAVAARWRAGHDSYRSDDHSALAERYSPAD